MPVNGTDASRRAAEIALAIARPTQARVVALYVSGGQDPAGAVLEDISALGDRYDANLRTQVARKGDTEAAILKEAGRGYDLLVMAVSPRAGKDLFYGKTATTVMTKRRNATVFVAS